MLRILSILAISASLLLSCSSSTEEDKAKTDSLLNVESEEIKTEALEALDELDNTDSAETID